MKPYWARLHFGGMTKRWHLYENGPVLSACERQSDDYPRIERREGPGPPADGKACKFCLAIHSKRARRAEKSAP